MSSFFMNFLQHLFSFSESRICPDVGHYLLSSWISFMNNYKNNSTTILPILTVRLTLEFFKFMVIFTPKVLIFNLKGGNES